MTDETNSAGRTVRCLHLSDLHAGMYGQTWLWPTLKHAVFDDLRRLMIRQGQIDLVIFSGDLVQRGSREDFDQLDKVLDELWCVFREKGSNPTLLTLPGNHDLERPNERDPFALLIKQWWTLPIIRDGFFDDSDNVYRKAVNAYLQEFHNWTDRSVRRGFPLQYATDGTLVGDQAIRIDFDGIKIGVVLLNSTWLQIEGGDFEGRLHVDTKQLLAITGNDPQKWVSENDFNLIVTHQPLDWLHADSKQHWNSEIAPSGRFDLHMFGHMHKPLTVRSSVGGGLSKMYLQAPSVFGLQQFDDGKQDRVHGYSLLEFIVSSDDLLLKLFPRKVTRMSDGSQRAVPDYEQTLDEDNSISFELRSSHNKSAQKKSDVTIRAPALSILNTATDISDSLSNIRQTLPSSASHQKVRQLEVSKATSFKEHGRAFWLIADWGMGSDEFIGAVLRYELANSFSTYRIDLQSITSVAKLDDWLRNLLGMNYQTLCVELIKGGAGCLILDLADTDNSISSGSSFTTDVERLGKIALDFCPELIIIFRSRKKPDSPNFGLVEITALSEADLRSYVEGHSLGGKRLANSESIRRLFRYTDGVPIRVDKALTELQVITIDELVDANLDSRLIYQDPLQPPASLADMINELRCSADPLYKRSFILLTLLSAFPFGEQLTRIRNAMSREPLFPAHAQELLSRRLIEVIDLDSIEIAGSQHRVKVLSVPRLIREYVRSLLSSTELSRMDSSAASLYFGPSWLSGIFKKSANIRFNNPHRANHEILNAGALVVRILRSAQTDKDNRMSKGAVVLATHFMHDLIDGHHYHKAAECGLDLLEIFPEEEIEKVAYLRYQIGRSLRMTGEHEKGRDQLVDIAHFGFSKSKKQEVLVNLAYCHQKLGDANAAIDRAKDAISIDQRSALALQAKSIILELSPSGEARDRKLDALERLSRKQNALIVANSIALTRAREIEHIDADKAEALVRKVLDNTDSSKDFYNRTRAAIKLANMKLSTGESLSEAEQINLVNSYHYLFNEKLASMFDDCHRALWRFFGLKEDRGNAMELFRHSSLVWRVRGDLEKERNYAKGIARMLGDLRKQDLTILDQRTAYCVVRSLELISSAIDTASAGVILDDTQSGDVS